MTNTPRNTVGSVGHKRNSSLNSKNFTHSQVFNQINEEDDIYIDMNPSETIPEGASASDVSDNHSSTNEGNFTENDEPQPVSNKVKSFNKDK